MEKNLKNILLVSSLILAVVSLAIAITALSYPPVSDYSPQYVQVHYTDEVEIDGTNTTMVAISGLNYTIKTTVRSRLLVTVSIYHRTYSEGAPIYDFMVFLLLNGVVVRNYTIPMGITEYRKQLFWGHFDYLTDYLEPGTYNFTVAWQSLQDMEDNTWLFARERTITILELV